jgi:hypothetical protein
VQYTEFFARPQHLTEAVVAKLEEFHSEMYEQWYAPPSPQQN